MFDLLEGLWVCSIRVIINISQNFQLLSKDVGSKADKEIIFLL